MTKSAKHCFVYSPCCRISRRVDDVGQVTNRLTHEKRFLPVCVERSATNLGFHFSGVKREVKGKSCNQLAITQPAINRIIEYASYVYDDPEKTEGRHFYKIEDA